jgi:hypothetical protein
MKSKRKKVQGELEILKMHLNLLLVLGSIKKWNGVLIRELLYFAHDK